jgi:hypothetical protein
VLGDWTERLPPRAHLASDDSVCLDFAVFIQFRIGLGLDDPPPGLIEAHPAVLVHLSSEASSRPWRA